MSVGSPNLAVFHTPPGTQSIRNQLRFEHLFVESVTLSSIHDRLDSHIDFFLGETMTVVLWDGEAGITSSSTIALRVNGQILQTVSGTVLNRITFSQTELSSANLWPIVKTVTLLEPDPANGEGATKQLQLERGDEFNVSLEMGSALNDGDRGQYKIGLWGTWQRGS